MIKQNLLIYDDGATLPPFNDDDIIKLNTLGLRNYELSNHLGNVLTVITDIKTPTSTDNVTVDGYEVGIVNISDYSPFGVQLDGRTISNGDYRYGFQGQEKDDEIKGGRGTSVNYSFRMHDPRVGRFFAVDPLTAKYPFNSPYVFSENTVINSTELEGLELFFAADGSFIGIINGSTEVRVVDSKNIEEAAKYINWTIGTRKAKRFEAAAYNKKQTYLLSHRAKDSDRSNIVVAQVVPSSDYVGYGETGDCYSACRATAEKQGVKTTLEYGSNAVQMFKSGTMGNNVNIEQAWGIINEQLEQGNQVIVGVDVKGEIQKSNLSTDNTTDHFVNIVGRGFDSDGRIFYEFFDNGMGNYLDDEGTLMGTDTKINRFFVNSDGTIEGNSTWSNYSQYESMKVSQVRININSKNDE
jgi:RHS repeat-associated protein